MNNVLLTDRVFLSLSVPLQPEQERELEESLLLDGCREPIITWNGVIIDGHKRYPQIREKISAVPVSCRTLL